MTTAERLQRMTDRAAYEKVANSYLRTRFPAIRHLIESGLNEKGESVKSPLDAFCHAGNNHFVLVEHTTDDTSLEKKWMFDRSSAKRPGKTPDGDLVKAIREASNLKTTLSSATFQIFLTTNQRVAPSLVVQATRLAQSAGIDLIVIELSSLSHFLDTDADGQYLRKTHLGIASERLSLSLMRELQEKCMEAYRIESYIDSESTTQITDVCELFDKVKNQPLLLSFLQAESGMGKTTVCYQLMQQVKKFGGVALRVTPELILAATSVNDLIGKTLLSFDSNLYLDEKAEELINQLEIILIADDLNNAVNSQQALNKLISWSSAKANTGEVRIICPVWNRVRKQVITDERKKDGVHDLYLNRPSIDACEKMVEEALSRTGISISNLDKADLIERSGRDTLLLGLGIHEVIENSGYQPGQARDIIRSFIFNKLESTGSRIVFPDVKQLSLVAAMARVMLCNRQLSPTYNDLELWLGAESESMKFCNALATDKELFYFDEEQRIRFRHDRVRDFILCLGMGETLDDISGNLNILAEPFYSDYLGLALAQRCTGINSDRLKELVIINPLAFFCAVKYLPSQQNSEVQTIILQTIEDWKTTDNFKNLPSAVGYAITVELSTTTSPYMNQLAAGFTKKNNAGLDRLHIAGFRNGDAMSAIKFLLSYPDFEPHYGNSLRDSMVDQVKVYHLSGTTNELIEYLRPGRLTQQGKKGALLLCGYLQQQVLVEPICNAWNEEDQKDEEMIWFYLWAVICCVGTNTVSGLTLFLDRFMALPDLGAEESGYPRGTKNELIYTFQKTRWRLSAEQLQILVSLVDDYDRLVLSVLGHIDHPIALDLVVRKKAAQLDASGNNSMMLHFISDPWNFQMNHIRLSKQSLDALEAIWNNPLSTKSERIVAFRTFMVNAEDNSVIRVGRLIKKEDTDLYSTASFRRALSGDATATAEYLEGLKKRSDNVRYLNRIWNAESKAFLREFLKREAVKGGYTEAMYGSLGLLRRIPVEEAEELLLENWEALKNIHEAVQTALYLSTDNTRAAAAVIINESDNPAAILAHSERAYECLDSDMGSKVSLHKLQSLEPYLQYLDEFDISSFANQAQRNGYSQWAKEKLAPFFTGKYRALYLPTTEDLIEALEERISKDKREPAYSWLSHVKHRNVPESDIMKSVEAFALTVNTRERFLVLAKILADIAGRKQLEILDRCPLPEDIRKSTNSIREWVTYNIYRRTLI